ncbi:MAG: helix-turn-helix domain-containing protein [Sedimentisphaeraceae bacterium JB056]
MPRLLLVASEIIDSPDYYYDNSNRGDVHHIVLKYTLSGFGVLEVNGKVNIVGPGQLFLMDIPSNETKYYYPSDADENWRFIYCCFNGDVAFRLYEEITSKYGHIFSIDSQDPTLRELFAFEKNNGKMVSAAFGAELIFRLLMTIIECCNSERLDSSNDILINKSTRFIAANLHHQINVSEVSHAVDVSREHLTRVFNEYLNITPRKYIEKQRIYQALKLLRNTDLSVKKVAFDCGFASASQFGRVFKRLMNDTPESYRRKKSVSTLPI